MAQRSMSFVGDSSLLPRCAEAAMAAGFDVSAVLTKDLRVAEWARSLNIPVFMKGDLAFRWSAMAADYLISAANLDMLPAEALQAARVAALNFHDGPLPRYAGLNAAAWALIQGETSHGVTWHEMTDRPDAGRIAATAPVAITADDDALTLNAKCFEAGLKAFEAIVADLQAGALNLIPQTGARTYFSRSKRPPLGGVIDPAQPAAAIIALVRGLHVGPYESTLGFAKIALGGKMYRVGAAQAADGAGAPGTVLACDEDSLTIATGTTPVRLAGLTCAEGAPVSPPAVTRIGDVIPALDDAARARLEAFAHKAAKAEPRQRALLRAATPLETPFAVDAQETQRFSLKAPADRDARIAALLAWGAHISDAATASAAFADGAAPDPIVAPLCAPWRPLTIATPGDATTAALTQAVRDARAALEDLGPFAADLRLRDAPADRAPFALEDAPLSISFGDHAPARAALVHASLNEAGVDLVVRAPHDIAQAIAAQAQACLDAFVGAPVQLRDIALGGAVIDGPARDIPALSIHDMIAAQAATSPTREAVRTRWETLSYAELDARASRIAAHLNAMGVEKGAVVGVCLERTSDLIATLLGVMRAGAAYLPLDPKYPVDRVRFMVEDSRAPIVVMSRRTARAHRFAAARIAHIDRLLEDEAPTFTPPQVNGDDLAYVIYTSGSTGLPKGVMIAHRAVANFFVGMDARIPHAEGDVWLAVTGPSFDISVLEMFWTLSRGLTVALHSTTPPAKAVRTPSFSLFYFAAAAPNAEDPYRLLFEGAKFADSNGFEAVWTPERHFHAFGAPYPNPAVTAAALAAMTSRVQIRAGSCVLPLHHAIRAAEEWSVVDVMSKGRVGIGFAAGWQPHDFVLSPGDFADRKNVMLSRIDEVRALWRGETVKFPDPKGEMVGVRTLPRPVQPELPVWLTVAKSPETFEEAGRRGFNVLTHMLGMTLAEVGENVRRYRAAWAKAGHAGQGRVTLMVHTFVGETDEDVRERVRAPMKAYLSNAFDLVRDASFNFPTIVQRALQSGKTAAEILETEPMSPEELDALLDHAFERYFTTSGLFGSHRTCLNMVQKIADIDVDEIACLVDFGVETQLAIDHLPRLKSVMDAAAQDVEIAADVSVVDDLAAFKPTHFQCTPSMASMVAGDPNAGAVLASMKAMMVGGEALPLALAQELNRALPDAAVLLNMYGPTETTIWSSVSAIARDASMIALGEPIANTQLRVAGADGRARPDLAPGELWIGGDGLARGYWNRDALNAERFVTHDAKRYYRTGDLVRRLADGRLEFLGRTDHQVKIRGHRIELGEIESTLARFDGVAHAVVIARTDKTGDQKLVGYFSEKSGKIVDERAVRAALSGALPDIMIPSFFVRVKNWPMTPNGKVDRKALPEPNATVVELETLPEEGLEAGIARIWREALGLERVGAQQNFFDLGGHSLSAVQVQRRIRAELSKDVAITDIFRFPTVRALAKHLSGDEGDAPAAAKSGADRAKARLAARGRMVANAAS